MNHIVKYNKPRAGSGAVSASGAAVALQSLAGLLTEAQLSVILEGYLLKETFDDLFVKESDGKGGYRIKAKYALYSNQYLSCLGNNPDAGTVALGATTLGGLNNVVAAADEVSAAAKVLVREAGASSWTLKNLSDIVGLDTAALATYLSNNHYATQQWVQLQGYLTEHQSLTDYATKVWVEGKGYLTAITKAQVEAVLTGNISTHSHSQYLTSTLAAQTYQPKGDYALTSALNSAVSSLNTAIGAKLDAATFDDLFVKESDGNGGYRIRAKYAFYSNQYISCLGNNPGAGTTTGGGVDLDAVAEYLTQQGYATQSWVQQQGYLKAADLSAYALADDAYLKNRQNRKSNAHTVASLTAVANSSDSWINNFSLSLINNNNALNFYVGGVLNERQALIQSGHNSNGYAQFLGVLHLNKLGGAVYINNSLALNAANVRTYAVTLDTEQRITGKKYFTSYETVMGSRVCSSGSFDSFANYPHYMWHVHNTQWSKAVMDTYGNIHFLQGGATGFSGYRSLNAASFIKSGGTSSQYLMADGSVRGETYFRHAAGAVPTAYVDLTTYTPGASGYANYQSGAYQVPRTGYSELLVNLAINGGSTSALQFYTAYGDTEALRYRKTIGANRVSGPWRTIVTELNIGNYALTPSNYTSTLDGRYINASGDTMTGALTIQTATLPILTVKRMTSGAGALIDYFAGNQTASWWCVGQSGSLSEFTFEYCGGSNVVASVKSTGQLQLNAAQGTAPLSVSSTTLVSNLNADMLDGYHVTSMMTNRGRIISNFLTWDNATGDAEVMFWRPVTSNRPYDYGAALCFRVAGSWHYRLTFDTDAPRVRLYQGINTTTLHHCGDLAFTSDNVASATKLQTARKIYGVGFNGTGDVNGAFLLNEGDATLRIYGIVSAVNSAYGRETIGIQSCFDGQDPQTSAYVTSHYDRCLIALQPRGGRVAIGKTSAGYPLDVKGDIMAEGWVRTAGNRGWFNDTYGGGWYMSDASWVRVCNNKGVFTQGEFLSGHSFVRNGYAGTSWNQGRGALGVGITNNSAQTPLIVAYREGAAIDVTGANRLFAMELLNSGAQLAFGFGGSMKFRMTSDGVFYALKGAYSDGYMSCLGQNTGSDMRLKHIIGDVTLTLDMIADAPAKLFRWRYGEFAGRLAVGSIAQYWQQWLAPVVSKRPDDYLQMDYGVTALTASICLARIVRDGLTDHERRILALETENKALKNRINELERRLAA